MDLRELASSILSQATKQANDRIESLVKEMQYQTKGFGGQGRPTREQYIEHLSDMNNPMAAMVMGATAPVQERAVVQAPLDLLISHEGAPDLNRVEEYKRILLGGGKIDPLQIINEGAKYGIHDGKHRFEALRQLGYQTAPIQFYRK